MTKQHQNRPIEAAAIPTPEVVAALRIEAQRLRAATIGGAIRRAIGQPRVRTQAATPAIPGPAAIVALKAEAEHLRAATVGAALRRALRGMRVKTTAPKAVEVRVRDDWYAPVIRSVLDKFAHQLDKVRDAKAANSDESNRAA